MDVIGWVGVGGPERQPGMQALAGHIGPPVDRRARRQASNHLTHPSSHQHTCVQARICWLQLRPPQPPTQPPHAQPARPPARPASRPTPRTHLCPGKDPGDGAQGVDGPVGAALGGARSDVHAPQLVHYRGSKGGRGAAEQQASGAWVGGWVGGREPAANTP